MNNTCGRAGHEWVRTRRPQASHNKTTSCLSHSMGGVHVLCWKALKEIKQSEGWFCTGVLFASWSQLVTRDKWAEVGNDHKSTLVIAMKACSMLYTQPETLHASFCHFRICTFFFFFFFKYLPQTYCIYVTKTQLQPGDNLTAWGVLPIWHVTFVLKSGRHYLGRKLSPLHVVYFIFLFFYCWNGKVRILL